MGLGFNGASLTSTLQSPSRCTLVLFSPVVVRRTPRFLHITSCQCAEISSGPTSSSKTETRTSSHWPPLGSLLTPVSINHRVHTVVHSNWPVLSPVCIPSCEWEGQSRLGLGEKPRQPHTGFGPFICLKRLKFLYFCLPLKINSAIIMPLLKC